MNRRICRQVLDCGDGVFGVTALAVAALNIAKRTADTATSTQSGDFEDSVAALQDADALAAAPFRFMAPIRGQPWRSRLSSNPNVAQVFNQQIRATFQSPDGMAGWKARPTRSLESPRYRNSEDHLVRLEFFCFHHTEEQ
jgi:hypothetical protein